MATVLGPYSPSRTAGNFVFLSGQIGDALQDIETATLDVIQGVKEILATHNLTLSDVVKTTVFMTDLGDFAKMNAVYEKSFEKPFPARSTVQVSALPKKAIIEIECVAIAQAKKN